MFGLFFDFGASPVSVELGARSDDDRGGWPVDEIWATIDRWMLALVGH